MFDFDPAKALADIERQRKEIEAKEQKLKQFLALGADLFPEQFTATPVAAQTPAQRQLAVAAAPKARQGTAKAAIIETAIEIMRIHGHVMTGDVLAAVEAKGVEIGAKDKLLQVSSILSREKQTFASDRSKGWSLVEKKPDSAGTLPGFGVADAT